jgi:hypothetical protein
LDAAFDAWPGIRVFGGLSVSRRLPSYQELFWSDSTVTRTNRPSAESHRVAEIGIEAGLPMGGGIRLAYSHRTIIDPILFAPLKGPSSPFASLSIANGPAIVTHSATLRLRFRVWLLEAEGNAMYLLQSSAGRRLDNLPTLSGRGGIFLRHSLFNGKLDLKTGFQGGFASGSTGMVFNPEVIAYVPSFGPALAARSDVNFFLVAHLGDAYIHFMWENLTDVDYFGTPFYPGGDRALRFGISWEFVN